MRRGLREVLDAEPDFQVIAESDDGASAVAWAAADDVDLAVLDVTVPRLTGLQAAAELARRRPELRVLMLSMHENEEYFFEALRAGASGYVPQVRRRPGSGRGLPGHDARRALRLPGAVRALIRDYVERAQRGEEPSIDPLSRRESEVIKLIAEGHTSKEIAALLVISENTVERHRANVLMKLGLRNKVDLTRYAIRRGLVAP